jgi:pyruvate/2-oxoglutarate dehydrogenase complex dihydrolipoamide acyltransferase (E2) component
MAVDILMPELGESVHEATVSKWLKQVGDLVSEDEPIVEIMTDKVNTELPAPASGTLVKIIVPEGGAVAVFGSMGVIAEEGEVVVDTTPNLQPATSASTVSEPSVPVSADASRQWLTPVVRAMAKQHGLTDGDLQAIRGTGEGGRITKRDVESYIKAGKATPIPLTHTALVAPVPSVSSQNPTPSSEVLPLTGMRKMIAEAMVRSSQIPTVSTVTQVDVTRMVQFRNLNKEEFLQQHGVKLTYTPFFIKATTEALIEFQLVNASLSAGNQISMHSSVHMGVAVALGEKGDQGLIVPVIRECEKKTVVEIAREVDKLAKAARSNTLTLNDVQGATFTITNPGTYGALFGTPMINAPQAGILGTYAIQKIPVVIDDMIAIRSVMHLVLTYDHRLVDGLVAGKFLASIRDRLAGFDFLK